MLKDYYIKRSRIDGINFYVNQLIVEEKRVKNLHEFSGVVMTFLKDIVAVGG